MTDREMIAAGIRFYTRTGRKPRRDDFRPPQREQWEAALGFKLPAESTVSVRFGGFTQYLKALGLAHNLHARAEELEEAALDHVLQAYPEAEKVLSPTNAYDLLIGDERVEVKGTALTKRRDEPYLHWTFRLHRRDFSRTVDAVFLVGMDKDLNPLIRLEFRGHGLRLLDGKDVITLYSNLLTGSRSQYAPYVAWRAQVQGDLSRLARNPSNRKGEIQVARNYRTR